MTRFQRRWDWVCGNIFLPLGFVVGPGSVIVFVGLLIWGCTTRASVAPYVQATERQCKFTPSETTIRNILAAKNEVLNDPETMARAICKAVANLGSERNDK